MFNPIAQNEYHVGFTGTRDGMSVKQKFFLRKSLEEVVKKNAKTTLYFHHGDCIGADAEAHDIAEGLGFEIVIHPPDEPGLRAFKKAAIILPEDLYLKRNRDIVDSSHIVLGCPKERKNVVRSGTWATIRYARNKKKLWKIIRPLV